MPRLLPVGKATNGAGLVCWREAFINHNLPKWINQSVDCVCCQDLALLVAFSNKNRRLQVSEKQVMVVMLLIRVQMDLINGISGTVFTQTFVYLVSSLKESLIADRWVAQSKSLHTTLSFRFENSWSSQIGEYQWFQQKQKALSARFHYLSLISKP